MDATEFQQNVPEIHCVRLFALHWGLSFFAFFAHSNLYAQAQNENENSVLNTKPNQTKKKET